MTPGEATSLSLLSRPDDDDIMITLTSTQFEQLLNRVTSEVVPESTKTTPVHLKFAPDLHNVFSFTAQLNAMA